MVSRAKINFPLTATVQVWTTSAVGNGAQCPALMLSSELPWFLAKVLSGWQPPWLEQAAFFRF